MFALKKIALLGAAGLAAFAISCSDDKEKDDKKYIPVYRVELGSSIDLDKDSHDDFTYSNNIITAAEGSYVAPLSVFVDDGGTIAMANGGLPIYPDESIPESLLSEFLPNIDEFRNIKETNQAFVDAAGSINLETDPVFVVLTGGKCFVVAVNLRTEKIVYLNPFETI
jgi:hypothetical protein